MKRTSTETRAYMRRHQGAKVEHFDVSNVIYHKFFTRRHFLHAQRGKRLRHFRIPDRCLSIYCRVKRSPIPFEPRK